MSNLAIRGQLVLVVTALTVLAACPHAYNQAHTALEVVAEATVATDAILAEAQLPALDKVKARLLTRYGVELRDFAKCRDIEPRPVDCLDPGDGAAYVERYYDTDPIVLGWAKVKTGVVETKRAILLGEKAVITWRKMDVVPERWPYICQLIQRTADDVTEALKTLEVDIPLAWDQGRVFLAPVCTFVGHTIVGEKHDKEVL